MNTEIATIIWSRIILKENTNESSIILETTKNIENRWMLLKIEEVIADLHDIRIFAQMIEEKALINMKRCGQLVDWVLGKVEQAKESANIEVIEITMKYLNGMKRFLASIKKESLLFYKELLESTIIAMVREIHSLEKKNLAL